jgi:P4 family phage/plasmid primase-like protien
MSELYVADNQIDSVPDDKQHGNSKAAIDFLKLICPTGPWFLASIRPEGGAPNVATFTPQQEAECLKWIEENNGRNNLYWHVSPTITHMAKKSKREDVRAVLMFHVDVDPRAGEDLQEERERILKMLANPPNGIPKPTFVIFSGGGFQAFWVLDKEIPINGDLILAEQVKLYNKQLELAFGADNCHNIDRLMRLPGTINIPDAKKLKKGRTRELAKLISHDPEAIYPLSRFTQAPLPSKIGPFDRKPMPGRFTENSIVDLDDVGVQEREKTIIMNGRIPGQSKESDDSRSAWVFDALCNMARTGISAEDALAIITDKNFKISESIYEKGSTSQKYAERQVQKAYTEVANEPIILNKDAPLDSAKQFKQRQKPHLIKYNGDWLDYDGASYVETEDASVESELYAFLDKAKQLVPDKSPISFKPTKAKVENVRHALEGLAHIPRSKSNPPCWLTENELPAKEILSCQNGLLHLPTGILHAASSNFFTRNALEFPFTPDAGDPTLWKNFLEAAWPNDQEAISTLQEVFGYMLMADTSQQKIILLVGPPRSGKGTIARILTSLIGRTNVCAPTLNSMTDSFGLQPLIGKLLAIVSDVRLGRQSDQAAIAENLLRISGEDFVTIARKYKSEWNGTLSTRFIIMTNEMPRFADASGALVNRFIPLVMSQSFLGKEDTNLTNKLSTELPAILNWAIEGWKRLNARGQFVLPESSNEAIQELTDLSSPVVTFIREKCTLQEGAIVPKAMLFETYREWRQSQGDAYAGTLEIFTKHLNAAYRGKIKTGKFKNYGQRVPCYVGIKLVPQESNEELPF